MPRSRGSEMPQRQSPRNPPQLRTSSSDSKDRSPKLGDRRSPRSVQSDSVNQKKLGTRIADLESQLGQAQEELKILKDQLVSAEAAKKEAQEELEKKNKKPNDPNLEENQEECPQAETQEFAEETDVFEVEVEKATVESDVEIEKETFRADTPAEVAAPLEPEKPSFEELALKNDEINVLKAKLEEKEKALEAFGHENEEMRKHLEEVSFEISSVKAKEEEMASRLEKIGEELDASKANAGLLKETLAGVEGAKEALEAEMRKLRVQTEQWKKAADAAAAILSGGMDTNGRVSERCGSMDKHFGGVFDTPSGGYNGFVGSPGLADDSDDGFGNGKRKGSGIRMFGDLWKKKSQK